MSLTPDEREKAPKRLTDGELAKLEQNLAVVWEHVERWRMPFSVVLNTIEAVPHLLAEVRESRQLAAEQDAARLSEEDRAGLHWARRLIANDSHGYDDEYPERAIAAIDRLLGKEGK